jgi:hypothetical protein
VLLGLARITEAAGFAGGGRDSCRLRAPRHKKRRFQKTRKLSGLASRLEFDSRAGTSR